MFSVAQLSDSKYCYYALDIFRYCICKAATSYGLMSGFSVGVMKFISCMDRLSDSCATLLFVDADRKAANTNVD